jgi:thiol:disulfide interchange protein DsbD
MLWVLTGMVEGLPLLMGMFGLVLIAMGCWIYGRWSLPHRSARVRAVGVSLGLAALAAGLWVGWPQQEEKWQDWSPERVAALRAEGIPVYVDYTAKWCFTCQVNKRVYKSPEIKRLIAEKKVVLLKADWTNEDPAITAALADLGKVAVPVNVLYVPGQSEPRVLDELDGLLTEDLVIQALKSIAD